MTTSKYDISPYGGPGLLALVFASILGGVTFTQAFYYYRNFKQDSRPLKALVVSLVILDVLHVVSVTHIVYFFAVLHFGDKKTLFNGNPWSVGAHTGLTTLTAIMVQSFLIWRIWIISKRKLYLVVPLALISLLACGAGLAYAVLRFSTPLPVLPRKLYIVQVSLISTAVADILITACSIYVLHTSRTHMGSTDTVIDLIIRYTIFTGLWASIAALMTVILVWTSSNTNAYFTFYAIVSKFFVNSFLAILNARSIIRSHANLNIQMSSGNGATTGQTYTEFSAGVRSVDSGMKKVPTGV